jgi:hypothetical protein
MTTIKKNFNKFLKEYNLGEADIYPTAGGEVSLNSVGTLAVVWTDGRYPEIKDGYSINAVCTETITVLYGYVIVDIRDEFVVLEKGDRLAITPETPYSMCGKSVCLVEISPKWDSDQNSFTLNN